ncbi:ankyrin [Tilletiopsis washingtonensis]|uniref:Ankyrin n=1 Tax=Tilletiopsis washingtonensis TaxID=58919 RepID=A0A316Z9X4_9BASI|nr:ankyrin [Tilletiopsis washingtonensis]PWN98369.1 ankyrin [Tilletiopsis washingtonensis]
MPVAVPPASTSQANIWVAAGEGDLARVQALVEGGLSPTVADSNTYTPVHAAASYGQHAVLRYLLSHASAPADAANVRDSDGDTPLFVVEDIPSAMLLLQLGADAKLTNEAGETAAETAEENGHEDLAAYLRSLTGEKPLYDRSGAAAAEEEAEGAAEGASGLSAEAEAAADARADELMAQVEALLAAAALRTGGGTDGEELELTQDEEQRLRDLVGESVLQQIREGWVGAEQAEADGAGEAVQASGAAETAEAAKAEDMDAASRKPDGPESSRVADEA